MTRYTVDAVAMAHYLVDALPPSADTLFTRAENGIDALEAPSVTISEAMWSIPKKRKVAGITVETTPNAVLRGLVSDGPVEVAPSDEQDLGVAGSLVDHHTLHDALLVANHRVRGTEAIITTETGFESDDTVWR